MGITREGGREGGRNGGKQRKIYSLIIKKKSGDGATADSYCTLPGSSAQVSPSNELIPAPATGNACVRARTCWALQLVTLFKLLLPSEAGETKSDPP